MHEAKVLVCEMLSLRLKKGWICQEGIKAKLNGGWLGDRPKGKGLPPET